MYVLQSCLRLRLILLMLTVLYLQYHVGANWDMFYDTFDEDPNACAALFRIRAEYDDRFCSSCEIRECPAGSPDDRAALVDCTNLGEEKVFDRCSSDLSINSGPFQVWTSGQFEECVDKSAPNSKCSDTGNPYISDGDSVVDNTALSGKDFYAVCNGRPPTEGNWFRYRGTGRVASVSTCIF